MSITGVLNDEGFRHLTQWSLETCVRIPLAFILSDFKLKFLTMVFSTNPGKRGQKSRVVDKHILF